MIDLKILPLLSSLGFTLAFYSFGRWLFFDLLGVKLLAEILAVSIILAWAILKAANRRLRKLTWVNIFVLMCFLLFAAGEFFGRSDKLGALEMLICFCFVLAFTQIDYGEAKAIGRSLAIMTGIIAFLGVLVTMLVSAEILEPQNTFFQYAEIKNGEFDLNSSRIFTLFGMVTDHSSFDYFGFRVWRLTSVTSEPARLSVYFLLPLVISFILGGRYAVCSFIIIFAIIFTNSVSLFLPLVMGVIFLLAQKWNLFLNYWKTIASVLLLGFFGMLVFYGTQIEQGIIHLRAGAQQTAWNDVFRGSSIPKIQSILLLVSNSLSAFPTWSNVKVVNGPLPFYLLAQGGVITMPLFLVGYLVIDWIRSDQFVGAKQFGICLLLGIWTTAMIFTTAPFFLTPAALICILVIFKICQPVNSR